MNAGARRDLPGTTLLEMILVGALVSGLLITLTSFLVALPHWHLRSADRLAVLREAQIAQGYLRRDMKEASSISFDEVTARLIVFQAGTSMEYFLVDSRLVRDVGGLQQTVAVTVSTFSGSFSRVKELGKWETRLKLCLGFTRRKARHHSFIQVRATETGGV